MVCETPCFDCPFVRKADKLHLSEEELFDFSQKHLVGTEQVIEEFECEEQGDTCAGQIAVLANGHNPQVDLFSDFGEAVESKKSNVKDFFWGAWEFLVYHEP
jgi:hypothetical protein